MGHGHVGEHGVWSSVPHSADVKAHGKDDQGEGIQGRDEVILEASQRGNKLGPELVRACIIGSDRSAWLAAARAPHVCVVDRKERSRRGRRKKAIERIRRETEGAYPLADS